MGTLTFTELKDELRAGLLGRIDTDPRLGRFLNLAQQRLARMHDFDEMEVFSQGLLQNTSSDDDRFLQLPTLREVYSIVLLDGAQSRKLVGRTPTYMDRIHSKPEYWTRDRPLEYCVWGRYIETYPLPRQNFVLRMRWSAWPADLVKDADVSQFNQKDELLIELALTYAFRSLGKEEDAAKHEAFAKGLLAEAKETDRTHPDRTVVAGPSDAAAITYPVEPWLNPFVRDIR